jgi:hypothetical protein
MKSKSDILKDPEVFSTSALAILFDEFGTECTEWDPDSLGMEILDAFNVDASDELLDRLIAGMALLTSNSFFVDVNAFTAICNSLNRGVVMSDSWVPADLDDVLWGVTEALFLLGDDYNVEDYSHNVKRYVGVLLQQKGIKKIPSVLSFAEIDEDAVDVYDAYGGDEIMEQAFWDAQQEEKDNLESDNVALINQYMDQLRTLPIRSEWLDQLKNNI